MQIGSHAIGSGRRCFLIAELSANHGQDYEVAARSLEAMKKAGADAVKVQTYTADTITLACDTPPFRIKGGTLWDGRTLHDVYAEASMPWEWQPRLQALAHDLGLEFFSSPFDHSAVDFLESLHVPAHKIASFEVVDLPLLQKVASTGKPVIMSTGMATLPEIEEALTTLREAKSGPVALLKCTSAYPAAPEEMNLRTIPDMAARFGVPIGLSDHTMGHTVPVAAVALGACIVEKHFILSRAMGGPDAPFSMEPAEFQAMAEAIRTTEAALGGISYERTPKDEKMTAFRRSLFISADVAAGEPLTPANVRSVRPADGLHPRHWQEVLGRKAARPLTKGTPLDLDMMEP